MLGDSIAIVRSPAEEKKQVCRADQLAWKLRTTEETDIPPFIGTPEGQKLVPTGVQEW
jgi:hypothetical protein